MTYPEDVLKAAREDTVEHFYPDHPVSAAAIRAGQGDGGRLVQMFAKVRMAERQRCAGELRKQIAGLHAQTEAMNISRDVAALEIALAAILGQREALARKFRAPSDEVMKGVTWSHGPCRVLKADAVGQQETGDDKA